MKIVTKTYKKFEIIFRNGNDVKRIFMYRYEKLTFIFRMHVALFFSHLRDWQLFIVEQYGVKFFTKFVIKDHRVERQTVLKTGLYFCYTNRSLLVG